MADRPAGAASENLRGIALMVLAMASFAVADAFIKNLAVRIPPGEIVVFLGLGGTLVFGGLALARNANWSGLTHPAVLLRNGSEALATAALITALSLIPLSTTSAIAQANPIVVTLGAALFLGERVGPHRWMAVFAGLFGVLIVIRPGSDAFEPGALFALVAMLAFAARDLATRRVPRGIDNAVLVTWGSAVIVPSGLILLAFPFSPPPVLPRGSEPWQLLGAVGFVTVAYYAITAAVRIGDISVLSPFRYTRMVFAFALGMVVFAERPDSWTYLGVAIIMASGLYTFQRERRLTATGRS